MAGSWNIVKTFKTGAFLNNLFTSLWGDFPPGKSVAGREFSLLTLGFDVLGTLTDEHLLLWGWDISS